MLGMTEAEAVTETVMLAVCVIVVTLDTQERRAGVVWKKPEPLLSGILVGIVVLMKARLGCGRVTVVVVAPPGTGPLNDVDVVVEATLSGEVPTSSAAGGIECIRW